MLDSQWCQEDKVKVWNSAVEPMKVAVAENAYDFLQISGSHLLRATMPQSTRETQIHDHDGINA